MNNKTINPAAFHLIGRTAESGLEDIDGMDLMPALYAGFSDVNKLRHDFPVVFGDFDDADGFIRSLSSIVNEVIRETVPAGVEGEFMRSHLLNLEQEIRAIITDHAEISLTKAWEMAVPKLRAQAGNGSLEALDECLKQVRGAFRFDGQAMDCDVATPMALVRQAWARDQKTKALVARKKVDELILKLESILGAEIKKSEETLSPENLKGSVGASFENAFDFDAMSQVLIPANPRDPLPEDRRQRIQSALRVLQSQRFFKSAKWTDKKSRRVGPYSFLFKSAASALRAIRKRVPDMVELTKAISIAELEIANRYLVSKHDTFFAAYDEQALLAKDMALFPSYLVVLNGDRRDAAEAARIIELLSSGMPVKILAQTDDILNSLIGAEGQLPFGGVSWQLANMAIGLNNVFVLQASGANLYKMRDKVWSGVAYSGPALFCVFSGDNGSGSGLSPYLVSAAATESRAFPIFSYDPSMGDDWASRLSIDNNPQLEEDWPAHTLSYEDENLQRVSEDIVFTIIEFIAGDKRFSKFFASVSKDEWTDAMVPIGTYLETASSDESEIVPYVLMVDENRMLHRLAIDNRLIPIARRCRDMWHSLQELGGVHNSHALKLLGRELRRWQAEKDHELAELADHPAPDTDIMAEEAKPAAAVSEATAEPEESPESFSDDPFIETPRCTTCNECTDINAQMFAYNDNMQAYIVDSAAGTYRQLVEAAESCQVSIIHPGKPTNMSEPNLEELMGRAELFC